MTHLTAAVLSHRVLCAVQGELSLADAGSILPEIYGAAHGNLGVQPQFLRPT